MLKKMLVRSIFCGVFFFNGIIYGAPVVTIDLNGVIGWAGSEYYNPWTPLTDPNGPYVDPNDLLQLNLASTTAVGNFTSYCIGGGVARLTNGFFGMRGNDWVIGWGVDNFPELAEMAAGNIIDYYLDTSVNTFGYTITNINTYGGWQDSGRDQQNYEIWYSVVGSANWIFFDSVKAQPASVPANTYSAIRVAWTPNLSNVDAVRFVGGADTEAGWTTMGEIDVIGTPSPKPSTVVEAGEDQAVWLENGIVDVSLNGTVTSTVPYTVLWSVVSVPEETVADISGHGHTGSLPNGGTWEPTGGNFDGALHFDGATQYVVHNYAIPVPRTTFSIVHWLKPEDLSKPGSVAYYEKGGVGFFNGYNDASSILEMHTGLAIPAALDPVLYPQIAGQTSAFFFQYQDGLNAAVPNQPGGAEVRLCGGQPVAGQWSHVAVTVDLNGFMKMYVDGVLVHSIDVSQMKWANIPSDTSYLGAVGNLYGPRMWKGSMDEVAVYNRELSQAEIQDIRNNGVTMSPQAYWPMDGTGIIFMPSADTEDVSVRLNTPGTYVFRLTADDGTFTPAATTTVTVYADACAYAQHQPGFVWMASDINHDCEVTLDDFAAMAANWLECYHPSCL